MILRGLERGTINSHPNKTVYYEMSHRASDFFEYGNQRSGYIKDGKCLDQLGYYKFHKENFSTKLIFFSSSVSFGLIFECLIGFEDLTVVVMKSSIF
jgi:hypothetical protein